ncbi:MAG: tRNA uridine-5-carboxymethylaminomethyl(34) synthesis enzyme MnmG [Bacteriovoracaceae bacterium]|nr:tRNA uridine-5-carboxymethylaminomethyl(34) synthesis enzyme MnmG [Bacteriovoracaceae bacterium]
MKFDLIVVGGGHAGVESVYIASQFPMKIALVTLPNVPIGSAPCNPSIGGVGKGQVVRELDALGGLMPQLADMAGIQYRTLNESKGHAVHSTRVQIDKELYPKLAEQVLTSLPNVTIIREKLNSVTKLENKFNVELASGTMLEAEKIVVTVGTFLNGKLHCGSEVNKGGRVDCDSSLSLQEIFSQVKKRPSRFKTGTPPRISKATINYSELVEQPSDPQTENFHYKNQQGRQIQQVSCYLARTNPETMKVIRDNKEKSPMYNGQIKAVGARYCPSIEDKAYRYPDKDVHHVFIEPEGLNLETMYPSGISSSLPREVQDQYVKSIKGLENCEIKVYGYAVEYDVIDTTDLKQTLEHKEISGLYFAGQVNGTSGYEEAGGQGYVAGANAALSHLKMEPLILSRHESYIGVMVEDLVSNHRDEPYRLFTSRAENRLFIREDNSILRMAKYRKSLGLSGEIDTYQAHFLKQADLLSRHLDGTYINVTDCPYRDIEGVKDIDKQRMTLSELLKQSWLNPVTTLDFILKHYNVYFPANIVKAVAISKKYEGYVNRANEELEKQKKMETTHISWEEICNSSNVSFECKERIKKIRPETFGQLMLIDGIRPATLAVVAGKNL